MVDTNKPSIKKKRRLKLTGPDDQYAKRDAVKEHRTAPEAAMPVPETRQKPAEKPTPAQQSASSGKEGKGKPQQNIKKPTGKKEQVPVNIRLPVGENLTKRLNELAGKHNQPIEPIIKAARKRAADKFKKLVLEGNRPEETGYETGGEVTRFATTFSGATAQQVTEWYDPFKLGVAKDGIKPIMVTLLQEEIKKICDAVG
jgi:hypothetical protein